MNEEQWCGINDHEWDEPDTLDTYCIECGLKVEQVSEITRLEKENESFHSFWKELCSQMFECWEMDYDFFLTYGEKFGLIRKEIYDPGKHGMLDDSVAGDEIYWNVFAPYRSAHD